ncbi:zf-HC2 domain-containing protein [Paenibacillus sp. LHD-38]|uniref:zf-HC2 domain-containing protein n=1 Tax=Paenibacillus sp. LHD-38 TaxID=3072143 RepID=UPI00280CC487|nr:zf-HC2 domain-containing protein [Paenibacillus sp. LHD-38]MDQ8737548.1 zf-HC2 domain-containing protein [Paenibacillus sp. LHD-38]
MRNGHIPQDLMSRYVNDRLAETERAGIEQHLTGCDFCLNLFMAAIASSEDEEHSSFYVGDSESRIPLPDMVLLEQRVVGQLKSVQELHETKAAAPSLSASKHEKPPRLRTWLQHPVTHYTIAASITLLLLVSGTFTSFSQKLAQMDMNENMEQAMPPKPPAANDKPSESWSDKIVDQTGSWLDGLKATRFK